MQREEPTMSRILSQQYIVLSFALAFVVAGLPFAVTADEENPARAVESAPASVEEGDEAKETIALVEQLRVLRRRQPTGETREEMLENYKKAQQETLAVADALYAKTADDKSSELSFAGLALQAKLETLVTLFRLDGDHFSTKQFLEVAQGGEHLFQESQKDQQDGLQVGRMALQIVLQALSIAEQLGEKDASSQMSAFINEVSQDPRPDIASLGKQLQLQLKFRISRDMDAAAIDKMATNLEKEFSGREIAANDVEMIMNVINGAEMLGQNQAAIRLYKFFANKFAQSKQPQIKQLASQFEGAVRRLNLPGQKMELSGTFLDGSELDWASYQGKVVLIDYWASWCGPCRQELPNLLANYKKYHDQGFDVIGINLDDSREAVTSFLDKEKLPWKTLFSDKPGETGWQNPMAARYGISGIPTVILIDREGKVISLQARGDELGKLLAEQFGGDKDSAAGDG